MDVNSDEEASEWQQDEESESSKMDDNSDKEASEWQQDEESESSKMGDNSDREASEWQQDEESESSKMGDHSDKEAAELQHDEESESSKMGDNSDKEVAELQHDEESESKQDASLRRRLRGMFHRMNVEKGTNYSIGIATPEEKKRAEEIKKRYEGTNERWYMHLDDEDEEDQQATQERNSIANVAERSKGKNKMGEEQESGWVSSKKMGEGENKDKETAASSESKRPRVNLIYRGGKIPLAQSYEKRTKDKMTETAAPSPSPSVTKSNNRPRIEFTDKEGIPAQSAEKGTKENNMQQTEPVTPPAPALTFSRPRNKLLKRAWNTKRDDAV